MRENIEILPFKYINDMGKTRVDSLSNDLYHMITDFQFKQGYRSGTPTYQDVSTYDEEGNKVVYLHTRDNPDINFDVPLYEHILRIDYYYTPGGSGFRLHIPLYTKHNLNIVKYFNTDNILDIIEKNYYTNLKSFGNYNLNIYNQHPDEIWYEDDRWYISAMHISITASSGGGVIPYINLVINRLGVVKVVNFNLYSVLNNSNSIIKDFKPMKTGHPDTFDTEEY